MYSSAAYFGENDVEAARNAYARALAIAQQENDEDLESRILDTAALVEFFHGNFQKAQAHALRTPETARPEDRYYAQLYLGGARLVTGDLQGSKPHIESARDLAERLGRDVLAGIHALSAVVSIYEGDWEVARRFTDLGLAVSSSDARCLAVRIQMEFELGEFAQGKEFLERLLNAMRLTPPGPNVGNLALALGIPLAARVTGADSHFEVAEAAGDTVLSSANCPTVVGWGARTGMGLIAVNRADSSAAAEHYASLASSRGTIMVWFSLVFDRVLGLLAHTVGNDDLATEHFEDALAICRNAGCRPDLAWTCCDYADTLLERNGEGDRTKATSLLDESLAISTELGMRPLMERVLSRREILKA